MFWPKYSLIFISIQIFYLLHLPEEAQAKKNNAGPKLRNLPLVLFKSENSKYSFPRCYRQDSEGKIRDFKATNGPEPMFFCPNPAPGSNGKFLYLVTDDDYGCKIPPEPTILKLTKEDGPDRCAGTGDLYSFGYNLSEKPFDKEYTSDHWQEIYSFCYVKEEYQVVYVSYRILSSNLLSNRQLHHERSYYEGVYRLEEFQDESLKAYIKVLIEFNSQFKNSIYTKIELGHPADMVFPIWKKPFYHAVNQGLILRVIKNHWKKIGTFVRKLAQKKLGEIENITGTLKYPDHKLFGTWWKLVIYKKQAMAIILHNVYIDSPEKDTNTTGHPPKADVNTKGESPKQETNVTQELQPLGKDTTVVTSEPSTSANEPSQMYPTNYELLCKDICKENGFHGLSIKYKVIAYCCDPKVITESLGLPTYEILNLKQTLLDKSVEDDGCPKDPIQVPTSEDEKPLEESNKTAKV